MTKGQFNQAVINTIARFPSYFNVSVVNGEVNFEDYVVFNPPVNDRIYHSYVWKEKFRELPSEVQTFFRDQIGDKKK